MVEEQEAQSKVITSEDQVKEWMNPITKSPELILALQNISQTKALSHVPEKEKLVSKAISKPSSSKEIVSCESSFSQIVISQSKLSQKSSDWFNQAYQQNILSMEDVFYHSDPFQAISKIFLKD